MDQTYNPDGGFRPPAGRFADLDGPDFFPTPAWATHALIDNEPFSGLVWEPACGDGSMARVLEKAGYQVIASDLYDRGFGERGVDFLGTTRRVANIVTNPPYNSAEGFIATALQAAEKKFAFLLRLAFLQGANRHRALFSRHPPARVWVFSERTTFYPAGAERKGSGTTAYGWFVWDRESNDQTELRWLKPGYKAASGRMRELLNFSSGK